MTTMNMPQFCEIDVSGRPLRIEYRWIGSAQPDAPVLVFLHEGLGSVAIWRDWPEAVCTLTGCRGLLYSRPGYGRSTPRAPDEKWPIDYLHDQAHRVLPAVLAALGVDTARQPPFLYGHSDGGSIALLYAAAFPDRAAGIAVAAPHIFVEDVTIKNLAIARDAYLTTGLRDRLARYHDDVDSAFWGWNDAWLNPEFRHWNIEAELDAITCDVVAMQGVNDEYGTLEQIRGIARRVPQTRLVEIDDCAHTPHKDKPDMVAAEIAALMQRGNFHTA